MDASDDGSDAPCCQPHVVFHKLDVDVALAALPALPTATVAIQPFLPSSIVVLEDVVIASSPRPILRATARYRPPPLDQLHALLI